MNKPISICHVPGLLHSFFHYFCQKWVLPLIFFLINFLCSICTISILTVTYRNLLVHQYYFRETKTVFKIWICPVRKTCILVRSIKIDIPISSPFLITSFHILYTGDTILFIQICNMLNVSYKKNMIIMHLKMTQHQYIVRLLPWWNNAYKYIHVYVLRYVNIQ